MKAPVILSGLLFAGMVLLRAGSATAAVLPFSPSTAPPALLEQVEKAHGWHCRPAVGPYRGWHRHPGACARGREPGVYLNLGRRDWGGRSRTDRNWDRRGWSW